VSESQASVRGIEAEVADDLRSRCCLDGQRLPGRLTECYSLWKRTNATAFQPSGGDHFPRQKASPETG
jgi:hypothetical protein